MTLPDAHDTARHGAERFGNTWRVFRLPAWPGGVYTASAKEPPADAQIVATYPQAPVTRPTVTPAAEQGSLF
jgi:hypothetical protein